MKDTCWKLFSYLVIDHKAAQAELNAMAEQGWELAALWNTLPLAKFRRTGRTDLRYFVDWADTAKPEANEYVQLCKDAGWELVHTMSYCHIYASTPGCDPLPIQTDPDLEYQRFRKKVVRRIALGSILPFLPYVLLWLWIYAERRRYSFLYSSLTAGDLLSAFFLSNSMISALILSAPLLLPLILIYLFCLARQLHAWGRAAREGHLPEPDLPGARRRGLLTLFSQAYILFLCIPLVADILLNSTGNWGVVLGFFLGSAIRWCMYDDPRIRRETRKLFAISTLVLVLYLARGPVREAVPSRVPAGQVLPQAYKVVDLDRQDTFLGSKVSWDEAIELPEEAKSDAVTLSFTVRTWAFSSFADRDLTRERGEAPAVEGYQDIWLVRRTEQRTKYLLRHDNTLLSFNWYNDLGPAPLDTVQDWLETYG